MRHTRRRFLLLTLASSLALPILAWAQTDDRDVAMWVLRKGGRVLLDGAAEYTSDPFELPVGMLRVVGVDMHGTVTDPKDLEPLAKLTELREVYVPARVWSPVSDVKAPYSDEMFDYFKNMKKLERFQAGLTTLAWLDLWDVGLARMAPLTQLKDLRVSLSTIKNPNCLAALVNLEYLDLDDTYVTDQTMSALAGMKNLRRLTLVGTLITDEGIKYL